MGGMMGGTGMAAATGGGLESGSAAKLGQSAASGAFGGSNWNLLPMAMGFFTGGPPATAADTAGGASAPPKPTAPDVPSGGTSIQGLQNNMVATAPEKAGGQSAYVPRTSMDYVLDLLDPSTPRQPSSDGLTQMILNRILGGS